MRLMEVLILCIDLLAVTPALTLLRLPQLWVKTAPLLAGILVIPHLFFEHYRWQMVPIYALTAVLCLVSIWQLARPMANTAAPKRTRVILWVDSNLSTYIDELTTNAYRA